MFLPFVEDITCRVRLLLSISRKQMLKQIIDVIHGILESIQSVLLFLIHLVQFKYFFSKTLKNSITPNMFQVFREDFL